MSLQVAYKHEKSVAFSRNLTKLIFSIKLLVLLSMGRQYILTRNSKLIYSTIVGTYTINL